MAADDPSSTKNSVYIQPRSATFQSHDVANNPPMKPMSAGQGTLLPTPTAWLKGSQKTLKP